MRERYIDIAKGIAIWCIVLLHYENGIFPVWLNGFIGSFMVTIFFIISGWTMAIKNKTISTKELFQKRLQTLGKPYFYWSIIILFFDLFLYLFGYYDSYFLLRETYKTLTLRGIGTLWFLPALLGGELLWNWAKDKNCYICVVLFFFSFLYLFFYHKFTFNITSSTSKIIEAPFHTIANAINAYLGVSVGYLFALYIFMRNKDNKKYILGWSIILLGVGCWLFNYDSNIALINTLISISCTLSLSISILIICYFIKTSTFFEYWGKNSLSLMVTHYSIVMVILMIINEKVFGLISNPIFLGPESIIYFLISIPIQYIITEIINSKYPVLISKRR